jgi:hypothetical protein
VYRLCADCAGRIERVGRQGLFENPASPCYVVL